MSTRTAIFAILTRLRQAVLHPLLVLKRLNMNIEAKKKIKGRSAAEKAGDVEDDTIKALLDDYAAGSDSKDMEVLLRGTAEQEEMEECLICHEVRSNILSVSTPIPD